MSFRHNKHSADLHISPDQDLIQKDDIVLETLVKVIPSRYFQNILSMNQEIPNENVAI